jgi:hypothetical protein
MSGLSEIWPFVPGQQWAIFYVTGLAVLGLMALNLYLAFRRGMPIERAVGAFFSEISATTKLEKRTRAVLIVWLVVGFLILVLDTQVNGMQIVDPNWATKR